MIHTLNLTINSSSIGTLTIQLPHVIVIHGMELHTQQVEHIVIHIPMQ